MPNNALICPRFRRAMSKAANARPSCAARKSRRIASCWVRFVRRKIRWDLVWCRRRGLVRRIGLMGGCVESLPRRFILIGFLAPEGELLSFASPRQLLLRCSTSCIHAAPLRAVLDKSSGARRGIRGNHPRIYART